MTSTPVTVSPAMTARWIGAAPRHKGLWFNFGHGHQGFTLGPAGARLLADLMEGQTPYTDAAGFSPSRFRQA